MRDSTVLVEAIARGWTDIVKLVLPASDPKAQKSLPLVCAAKYGQMDLVKLLLPLSDPSDRPNQAFLEAKNMGLFEIALYLLPYTDKSLAKKLLPDAFYKGRIDVVRDILPFCSQDDFTDDLLVHAAMSGDLETVKLALKGIWTYPTPPFGEGFRLENGKVNRVSFSPFYGKTFS